MEDLLPFRIKRVVAPGANSSVYARVKVIQAKPLTVSNLKTVTFNQKQNTASSVCSAHDDRECRGHLQVGPEGQIGLPQFLVTEDEFLRDERAKANADLFQGGISSQEYAERVRSTMMGKKGMVRSQLMSIRPMTGARGIATCVWDIDPRTVLLPKRWMERMKVPYRASTESGLQSPFVLTRPVCDGDLGVILRCPVISVDSLVPVRFQGWDQLTIGVNPELCSGMNLDFDGDEVHIAVVSSAQARLEIETLLEMPFELKFSAQAVTQAKSQARSDFMMGSTRSVTELSQCTYQDKLSKLSRCKESSRLQLALRLSSGDQGRDFVYRSFTKISETTKSHMSVSDGYTFARQLKLISLESRIENGFYHAGWRPRCSAEPTSCGVPVQRSIGNYGFPAVRLVTKLTNRLIQSSLDLAKHSQDADDTSMIVSLFSCVGVETVIYRTGLEFKVERSLIGKERTQVPYGTRFVTSSSRRTIAEHCSTVEDRRQALVTILVYICKALNVPTNQDELASLTSILCLSLEVKDGRTGLPAVMTSTSPVNFLSSTVCNDLTVAICENLSIVDRTAAKRKRGLYRKLHPSSPVVAICTASMSHLQSYSVTKLV